MAGLTPIPLAQFRDALGARGLSITQLAAHIECGRSHLSQVLWGERAGGDTWARIRAVVTDEEWQILLQMKHCATWNTAQLMAPEQAQVWLLRVVCAWCDTPQGFKKCERAAIGVSHGLCPACFAKIIPGVEKLRKEAA